MRTPLLFAVILCGLTTSNAQEIPGETPGDLGSIVLGLDTLTLVRAADGNAWLQQNLGADEVATAMNVANAFGDLYQWGRWTDGHQLRTSTAAQASMLAANNPAGLGAGSTFFYIGADPTHWWSAGNALDTWQGTTVSASNGKDPCAALGTGWQLPSQADWMNVLSSEGITGMATAFASNLKLPAAGSRDGQTGTLINEGQFGNYWSSTPSTTYAKDLTIGDSFVNNDDDAYRSYGMSVRCLNRSLHTGLLKQGNTNDLVLFPNPSNGTFTVKSNVTILRIVVYDALSHLMTTMRGTNTTVVMDPPSLPAGIYLVQVETANSIFRLPLCIER